jgi:hypothetical protein
MRTAVTVLRVIWFPLFLVSLPELLPAQAGQRSGLSTTTSAFDSASAAGLRDGNAAARKIPVSGRGAAGFMSGLPVGFLGPFLIFGGNPVGALGVGAGGAGIYAAAQTGNRVPSDSLTALAEQKGAEYAKAFSKGYSDRLLARRRSAALIGGVGGTATGFGALFLLIVAAFSSE